MAHTQYNPVQRACMLVNAHVVSARLKKLTGRFGDIAMDVPKFKASAERQRFQS